MSARPGKTVKLSVSIDAELLSALRQRARRIHGGNLSAAITEGVRRAIEEEGREALLAWLGPASELTPAERATFAAERAAAAPPRGKRKARAA
jgi:hypothetical protein